MSNVKSPDEYLKDFSKMMDFSELSKSIQGRSDFQVWIFT